MIALIPIAAVATAAIQDAGWDLMTNTKNAFYICSLRQGVRLDDRRTSPEVIARGAMRACNQEWRAFEDAMRAKAHEEMPTVPLSETEPMVTKQLEELRLDVENLTIQAILEQRTSKHAAHR